MPVPVPVKRAMPVMAVAFGVALLLPGSAGAAVALQTGSAAPAGAARPATHPAAAGRFYGVAAAPGGSAWAVGLNPAGSLIMRWQGKWVQALSAPGFLVGVTAPSADDVWAVGGTDWFSPQTLAEHWNGQSWTPVATPSLADGGFFNSIAATSADNAWAVGGIGPGPGVGTANVPLIEHWNGQSWSLAQYPAPAGGQLRAVAATSGSNVWAVGWIGSGPATRTLIEHWNGTRWRQIASHAPGGFGTLQGIAATGPDNAWAVGYTQSGPGGSYQSLTLHWNGYRWSVVPSPNPTGQTDLIAVAAASPQDAWAVGYTNPNVCSNGGPQCGTAAFHWNGSSWAAVPSANPPAGYLNAFEDVVIISADNVWAVGTTDWASTLIEHWNGSTWGWHLPR